MSVIYHVAAMVAFIASRAHASEADFATAVSHLTASNAAHARTIADLMAARENFEARLKALEATCSSGGSDPASGGGVASGTPHRDLLSLASKGGTSITSSSVETSFANITGELHVKDLYWRGQLLGFDPPTAAPTAAPSPAPTASPTSRLAWVFPGNQASNYFIRDPFTWPAIFTLQLWVKPFNAGKTGSHFFSYASASSTNYNCLLLRNQIFDVSSAGKWTYVAMTYDGLTSNLYIDGVSVGVPAGMTPFCGEHTGAIVIGQEQDAYGGGFDPSQASNSHQDAVAVYNRVWSASEIAVPTTCVDTSDPSLYALWGDAGEDLNTNGWGPWTGTVVSSGMAEGITCT